MAIQTEAADAVVLGVMDQVVLVRVSLQTDLLVRVGHSIQHSQLEKMETDEINWFETTVNDLAYKLKQFKVPLPSKTYCPLPPFLHNFTDQDFIVRISSPSCWILDPTYPAYPRRSFLIQLAKKLSKCTTLHATWASNLTMWIREGVEQHIVLLHGCYTDTIQVPTNMVEVVLRWMRLFQMDTHFCEHATTLEELISIFGNLSLWTTQLRYKCTELSSLGKGSFGCVFRSVQHPEYVVKQIRVSCHRAEAGITSQEKAFWYDADHSVDHCCSLVRLFANQHATQQCSEYAAPILEIALGAVQLNHDGFPYRMAYGWMPFCKPASPLFLRLHAHKCCVAIAALIEHGSVPLDPGLRNWAHHPTSSDPILLDNDSNPIFVPAWSTSTVLLQTRFIGSLDVKSRSTDFRQYYTVLKATNPQHNQLAAMFDCCMRFFLMCCCSDSNMKRTAGVVQCILRNLYDAPDEISLNPFDCLATLLKHCTTHAPVTKYGLLEHCRVGSFEATHVNGIPVHDNEKHWYQIVDQCPKDLVLQLEKKEIVFEGKSFWQEVVWSCCPGAVLPDFITARKIHQTAHDISQMYCSHAWAESLVEKKKKKIVSPE